MKISVFLNNDLESNVALNCLLPELSKHQFNLFFSPRVGAASKLFPLQCLEFLEREFLSTTLFSELERRSYGGFLSFNEIANSCSTSIVQLQEVTSRESLMIIKEFQPDLFISIRFGIIFKGEALNIPLHGIINLHSAILPNYKGVLGTLRAFQNTESEIGSTIHYIGDSSIDTGRVIHIHRKNIIPAKTVLWHIVNLYPDAINKLNLIIAEIAKGKVIESTPQPPGGNYYSFPTESDLLSLRKNGIQLFNLHEYGEMLNHFYKVDHQWVISMIKEQGDLPEYL